MSAERSSGRNKRRFVPRVEDLEDRTVPANVRVAVMDHTLYVTGADAGSQVWIAGDTATGAVVRALDATTTLNGQSAPVFVKNVDDIMVQLSGGDEELILTTLRNKGTLAVTLGGSNNTFTLSGAGNSGGTFIHGGTGNNTFTLSNSLFHSDLAINTGTGDNQITANNIEVINFRMVNPSNGSDFFNNVGSTIIRTYASGTFTPGTLPNTLSSAPTVTLSSAAPSETNKSPITFLASVSAPVTGFSVKSVQVTNGAVTSFTQLDSETYTFQVTPEAQGAVTATVLAGAATDVNGNPSAASNTVSVTFDTTPPIVQITPETTNNTTPDVLGTVNEAGSTVQVTVNGHTYTAVTTGTHWVASVTNTLAQGTYSVTATATDPAGNVGTSTNSQGLVVDTTPPTATFSASPAQVTNVSPETVTITFSKPVTGVTASAITVTNGTSGTFTAVSSEEYKIVVTPKLNGTVTVTLAAGAGKDEAGNESEVGSFSITFDNVPPTGTIDATGDQEITGTSTDATSGVKSVSISIENSSNQFYTGPTNGFSTATQTFLPVTTTNNFANWSLALLIPGTYTVDSMMTDNAGNAQTITQTVTVS